jgi:hypothetical protein
MLNFSTNGNNPARKRTSRMLWSIGGIKKEVNQEFSNTCVPLNKNYNKSLN